MHAVNATIASKKPLFVVRYNSPTDKEHEKVLGNAYLVKEKGAYPLQSTTFDSAIEIINASLKREPQSQMNPKSLFDL